MAKSFNTLVRDPQRSAHAAQALGHFASGESSHLVDVLPQDALLLPARSIFDALHARLGPVLAQAIHPAARIPSPKTGHINGQWLKSSHTIGINIRTTGDLLGALKYVLTLPPHVDSIHLLPIFEPGVVGSLYGQASWHLNQEFFSRDWASLLPAQSHINDQLRAFVNLCHALGKTVGLDVIPHTDRFSEIALCNPWLFEWVRRRDDVIIEQRANLHEEVMEVICGYIFQRSNPRMARYFFSQEESAIANVLFGDGSASTRNAKRDQLIQWLYNFGYETLPATMAPPYRGLELESGSEAVTVDDKGRNWREYRFTWPEEMSRVFGPLTRYRLWESKDNNRHWQLDHTRPRMAVWHYVANHYQRIIEHYGFDFMRGDMSHVQTRPEGVPIESRGPYDLLRFVKEACAKTYPHFGYFAESFLTADNYMAYGSEAEHLEMSEADVALGNLQNYNPAEINFHKLLYQYLKLADTRSFAPVFTLFTADKDDPRFDQNFLTGNVARYFFSVFCPALPSYNALGYHTREPHLQPAPNEHYSKFYVFHYDEGPKATTGPFVFGKNLPLWSACQRMDAFRQKLRLPPILAGFKWVLPPDVTGKRQILAWINGDYFFAVNFGAKAEKLVLAKAENHALLAPLNDSQAKQKFSASEHASDLDNELNPIFSVPREAFDVREQILAPDAGIIAWA